jgi:mannose-6-phosphate isomerase-like protein (cupin superfamily)
MKPLSIYRPKDLCEVLETTGRSRSAVMKLGPAQAGAHEASDQVLLLVQGALRAEAGGKHFTLKAGEVVTILPGVKHGFFKRGEEPTLTFNLYSPPGFTPDENR